MRRIMVLGDSGTIAAGVTNITATSIRQVEDSLNALVHNFSYGGATMADLHTDGAGILPGMFRQLQAVRQLQLVFGLDMVLVAIGSNDWGFGIPLLQFRNAYAELLDGLKMFMPHSIAQVVCMTPPWRAEEAAANTNGETLDQFRDTIATLATDRGMFVIRGEQAIPRDPAFYFDEAHPNELGHKALAKFMTDHLRSILKIQAPETGPQGYFWRYRFLAKVWKILRDHL